MPGIMRCSLRLPETEASFAASNGPGNHAHNRQSLDGNSACHSRKLVYLVKKQDALNRFKHFAQEQGVAAERLLIAPFQQPVECFIATMDCAELFLDTLEFNAVALGVLAINASLPVLTKKV